LDCKSSNTYYKISKETLLNLLTAKLELSQLECSGVDNWTWYGEGYQEFMKEEALGYVSEEEMPEDPDAEYVAKLMLKDFEEI
jgi:hypothetical protein